MKDTAVILTVDAHAVNFYQRGKKGLWNASFTYIGDSSRHRIACKTVDLEEAKEVVRRKLQEIHSANVDPKTNMGLDFLGMAYYYYEHLEKSGRSYSTLKNAKMFEQRFFQFFPKTVFAKDITKAKLEEWKHWLSVQPMQKRKGTLGPKTVTEHLNWVASIFLYNELRNPCAKVSRPKKSHNRELEERKFYTHTEVGAILKASKELSETEGKEWRFFNLVLRLIAFTGCRYSEIMLLTPADLNRQTNQLFVSKNKKSETRGLTLTGSFSGVWQDVLELEALAKDHWGDSFCETSNLVPYSINWFRKTLVDRFSPITGLPYKGVHAFRHAFATNALVRSKWSIDYLAKWLGHDRSVCFSLYSHLIAEAPPAFSYS